MQYRIPTFRLYKLRELSEKLKEKGVDVVLEIIPDTYSYEKIVSKDESDERIVQFVDVDVSGVYENKDYQFVAKIEHFDTGNVITKGLIDENIPDEYYKSKAYCNHCNTYRNRKETYLVKNIHTNKYLQVGKSCLKEYTSMSLEVLAMYLEYTDNIVKSIEYTDEFFQEVLRLIHLQEQVSCDVDYIKQVVYFEVLTNGYNKFDTCGNVYEKLCNKVRVNYVKEIKEIDEYASKLNSNNDFLINCKNNWFSNSTKHINLLASFISYYLKDMETRKQNKNTIYVGNVGEKIEIKISSVRVLFKNYGFEVAYNTYTPDTYVYKILDEKGNCFIWETAKELREGETIKATIKAHKEYKEEKQTIITRGKILGGN